jgi:hypothetical protein
MKKPACDRIDESGAFGFKNLLPRGLNPALPKQLTMLGSLTCFGRRFLSSRTVD